MSLTKMRPAKGLLFNILSNLKTDKLKITNLIKFLNLFLQESNLEKLKTKFKSIAQFSETDKKEFINQIRVVICK